MRIGYIESWTTDLVVTEEMLASIGMVGKSVEEVEEFLNGDQFDGYDSPFVPHLFEVRKLGQEPIYFPKDTTELYEQRWEEAL